jgi:hypothetical protein
MSVIEELQDAPGLAYLASPYSHDDPAVRHARYRETRTAWARLTTMHIHCISPIVMCHELAVEEKLPWDAVYWRELNSRLFFSCLRTFVLALDEWEKSKGVGEELRWSAHMNRPTYIVTCGEKVIGVHKYDTTPHR